MVNFTMVQLALLHLHLHLQVHVTVRTKRGEDPQKRLNNLLEASPVFDLLRQGQSWGDLHSKVSAVHADISLPMTSSHNQACAFVHTVQCNNFTGTPLKRWVNIQTFAAPCCATPDVFACIVTKPIHVAFQAL